MPAHPELVDACLSVRHLGPGIGIVTGCGGKTAVAEDCSPLDAAGLTQAGLQAAKI